MNSTTLKAEINRYIKQGFSIAESCKQVNSLHHAKYLEEIIIIQNRMIISAVTEYKETVEASIKTELEKWKSNNVKWTVSNQFDETILESALENINPRSIGKAFDHFEGHTQSAMTVAHFMSSFEAPEISSSWVD